MELHFERGKIRAILPCTTGVIVRTETDTFDYPGACVFPGFVDNHAHILGFGAELRLPSLRSCSSIEECVQVLRAATVPESGWLYATGWNEELWQHSSPPTPQDLDAAFPTTPVVLSRVDGHALWINTAAANASGIDAPATYLVDEHTHPVWHALPDDSVEEKQQRILAATTACVREGITEIHDMDVHPADVEIMRSLAESGKLPVRVQSFVSSQDNQWQEQGTLPAGGELQRTVGIKLFADGALGSRGAALLAPYSDAPETSGTLFLTKEKIIDAARAAIDAGWWAIAIHAIGDAAVRLVLDAYEVVRGWPDGADIVLRIEHAQHVHPYDWPRFAELNVFACIQPQHCTSDAPMALRRLGEDRLQWAYPWKSLLSKGARIAGGSDFPIEPPSPLTGMADFMQRVPKDSTEAFTPKECVTVHDALAAYTAVAHASADLDYRRGKIEIGFDADVVILDRDITSCAPDEVRATNVLATFVAGQRRYQR